jgi:hypothetical protein
MSRRTRTTRRAFVVAIAAALLAMPAIVTAHGSYGAGAAKPRFNDNTLRLVGRGGYATERRHQAVRVTVCLQKRYGARYFDVRCNSATDDDRSVRARVSVPGCVDGSWRTTAAGEALGRGEWKHAESDISAVKRC